VICFESFYSPLKMFESMAEPFSVKAKGNFRVLPHLDVPNWKIKFLTS